MIEQAAAYSANTTRMAAPGQNPAVPPRAAFRPVFQMIDNDRMAGSIPAWVRPNTAQDQSVAALSNATNDVRFSDEVTNALAYNQNTNAAPDINQEPFGFGDVIDIVNPLHHIPLVGTLYRHVTGDQIRPSSQIIGGTLFGGPLGAASGIANAIIEEETGNDIGEHALVISGLSEATPHHSDAQTSAPVTQLAAAETPRYKGEELPASALGFTSALSFADLSYIEPAAGHPQYAREAPNRAPKPLAAKPSALAAQYRFND